MDASELRVQRIESPGAGLGTLVEGCLIDIPLQPQLTINVEWIGPGSSVGSRGPVGFGGPDSNDLPGRYGRRCRTGYPSGKGGFLGSMQYTTTRIGPGIDPMCTTS